MFSVKKVPPQANPISPTYSVPQAPTESRTKQVRAVSPVAQTSLDERKHEEAGEAIFSEPVVLMLLSALFSMRAKL